MYAWGYLSGRIESGLPCELLTVPTQLTKIERLCKYSIEKKWKFENIEIMEIFGCLNPIEEESKQIGVKVCTNSNTNEANSIISLELMSTELTLTWAWLIKEVIRLYNLQLSGVSTMKSQFLKNDHRIAGLYNKRIGFKTKHSEGSVYVEVAQLNNKWAKQFILWVSGPIAVLPDTILSIIGDFLNDSAYQLASLRGVSRQFKRVFTDCKFWQNYSIRSIWHGRGHPVEDDSISVIAAGLPRFNALRVQWCANHTSRLRLYIGYLPHSVTSNGFLQSLIRYIRPHLPFPHRNLILVYGNDPVLSKNVHAMVSYLLPQSSKIDNGVTNSCLIPGDTLIGLDHVPNLGDRIITPHGALLDISTIRIERRMYASTRDTIRVIGDSRLRFVHILPSSESDVYGNEEHSRVRLAALQQVSLASVIVLQAGVGEMSAVKFNKMFRDLYNQQTSAQLMMNPRSSHQTLYPDNMIMHSSNFALLDEANPCLIFLPILNATPATISKEIDIVFERVSAVIGNRCEYFIQPFDPAISSQEDLQRKGFMLGINWLVRCLSKKVSL